MAGRDKGTRVTSGAATEVRILAGAGSAHLEVMRSHFYGVARPLDDASSLVAFVAELRGRYPKARHVVHAWIGPPGSGFSRSSDDGEPHGTGGLPCLGALQRAGLEGSAVAVARIFGGTLLGAANLGRTYGRVAQEAVAAAGVRVLSPVMTVALRVPIAFLGRMEALLGELQGEDVEIRYEVADPVNGTGVLGVLTASLPAGAEAALQKEASERTQGQAEIVSVGRVHYAGSPTP